MRNKYENLSIEHNDNYLTAVPSVYYNPRNSQDIATMHELVTYCNNNHIGVWCEDALGVGAKYCVAYRFAIRKLNNEDVKAQPAFSLFATSIIPKSEQQLQDEKLIAGLSEIITRNRNK